MNDQVEDSQSNKTDLPIFVKWMDFVKWLLVTTDGFPKTARFTFSDRLTRLALDIVEDLIEARYNRSKNVFLRRANLNLEKMRILLRICFEMRYLSRKSYAHASLSINEVGKMLGGWMKQQGGSQ
jgi:four helix bundle protein